jgi:hypothetical protein
MKSVRPDNTNPIPLRTPPPPMGIIMIRFVGLLLVAVVVLALSGAADFFRAIWRYG